MEQQLRNVGLVPETTEREGHIGPLNVVWDNALAHRDKAVREFLQLPDLKLQLVNLSGYSPDFDADEAIWG